MLVILHYYRNKLEPFRDALEAGGIPTLEGLPNGPATLGTRGLHLIWGSPPTNGCSHGDLARRTDVWFAENGWLPPDDTFYVDPRGSNADSTIPWATMTRPAAPSPDRDFDQWVLRNLCLPPTEPGVIFCPLQCEEDNNIQSYSQIQCESGEKRGHWFARRVAESFTDYTVVFRPHPKDDKAQWNRVLSGYANAKLTSEGTSLDWARRAAAVVGVNSTCLVEAIALGRPVAALGAGVFSGNNVALECCGDAERLRRVLTYKPDPASVLAFLRLLFERQIPIDVRPDQFHHYPMLRAFINQAREERL